MKKISLWFSIIILIFTMVIGLALTGCKTNTATSETTAAATTAGETTAGETTAAAQETKANKDITIAVIPTISNHPWFSRCGEFVLKAGQDLGINVIWVTQEKSDAAKQMEAFEDMVNKKVDAILLAAVDSDVMAQPVKEAQANGIPVFGWDVGVGSAPVVYLTSALYPETTGKFNGERLAELMNYKGKVAVMTGQLGSEYMERRKKAMEDALLQYPDISIVGEYADEDDQAKAVTIWESVLKAHPDLGGMACISSGNLAAAGIVVNNAGLCGQVQIAGDGLPSQNRDLIKSGCIKGAALCEPGDMAYIAVLVAYNYLLSGTLPKEGDSFTVGDHTVSPTIVDSEKALYIPNLVFTPENVDTYQF